jgi:putative thioredoxin
MVIDVSESDFQEQVLDRSHEVPVVVDFWADWCGPCKQLTPVLEREATEREGDVVLAKVDVDANPQLSQAFRVQGIPAVKAFKDGKVLAEFTGAQPPAQVKKFFDALVPSEAERLVADADDEQALRRALELEPRHDGALFKLAKLLHRRGDDDEALELLDRTTGNFAAEGLAARIRLQRNGEPDLTDAWLALDEGRTEEGLSKLEAAIAGAEDGARDDIRKAMVGVFDELGPEDELARAYRRRLAAVLN